MKKQIITTAMVLVTLCTSSAYAEGCLKGAVVGGILGHVVGKHKVLGAVGGCVVGRNMANKEKERKEMVQTPPKNSNQPQIITNNQINNK